MNAFVLLVVAVEYLSNNLLLKPLTGNWFVHLYLNDMFAMPFMLAYSNGLILMAGREDLQFRSLWSFAALTIACSLVWECAAPIINQKSVFDGFDFLAYSAGAGLYFLVQSTWQPKSTLHGVN